MIALKNGKIIADEGILEGKSLIIKEGKIAAITDNIEGCSDIIDVSGNYISPGFIDIHIHGAGGCDTMNGDFDSINRISQVIAKHGVTSFLPTTMTTDPERIKKAIKAVKECMERGTEGASVLGAHLEGPFINEKVKGAQDGRFVRNPDIENLLDLIDNDFSAVKSITIAPELEGANKFISYMIGHGVTVSAGHTNGTYNEIMEGIGKGITHSTHLFNAMRGFTHREPGVVGAVFDSRISTEFIADGIHSHFAAIRLALAVKSYENCALITDAMEASCMEDGAYELGGQEVFVKDGAARLKDGTLAGSTLTIDNAVRNIMRNTNLNLWEAVYMATAVPAKIIKVSETKGRIRQGMDADIIVFDPDINIKTTMVGGKIVYK